MKDQILNILQEQRKQFDVDEINKMYEEKEQRLNLTLKNGVVIKGDLSFRLFEWGRQIDVTGDFVFVSVTDADGNQYNLGKEGESAWAATKKSIKLKLSKHLMKIFKENGGEYNNFKYDISIRENDLVDFNSYVKDNSSMVEKIARSIKVTTKDGVFSVEKVTNIDGAILIVWLLTPSDPNVIPFYNKHLFWDLEKELFRRTKTYLNKESFDVQHAINGTFRYHK